MSKLGASYRRRPQRRPRTHQWLDVSPDNLEEVMRRRSGLPCCCPRDQTSINGKNGCKICFLILDLNFYWSRCHEFSNSVHRSWCSATLFSYSFSFSDVHLSYFNNSWTCFHNIFNIGLSEGFFLFGVYFENNVLMMNDKRWRPSKQHWRIGLMVWNAFLFVFDIFH